MLRLAIFLVLLFVILLALRALRLLLASFFGPSGVRKARPARVEGDMVRDPICGVWIDRRLALTAGSGASERLVCSEECRRAAERTEIRAAP